MWGQRWGVLWHSFYLKTLQNIFVETLVDHLPCWKIFMMQNTLYLNSCCFEAWHSCLFHQEGELLVLTPSCLFSSRVIVEYPWPFSNGNIVQKVCHRAPQPGLPICQWMLWYISFFIFEPLLWLFSIDHCVPNFKHFQCLYQLLWLWVDQVLDNCACIFNHPKIICVIQTQSTRNCFVTINNCFGYGFVGFD